MKSLNMRSIKMVGVLFLLTTLFGCGGVKGDYTCKGGLLDSLQLKSDEKAYVTMLVFGQKMEKAGTYTVDGDKINVIIDGESMLFTKSGKALNGGELFGTCTK